MAPAFLKLTVDGSNGQLHATATLSSWKETARSWVRLRVGLDAVETERILYCPEPNNVVMILRNQEMITRSKGTELSKNQSINHQWIVRSSFVENVYCNILLERKGSVFKKQAV
jgi:hypothetical protein